MEFSMDGFRRQLSKDVEALNEVITQSNVVNCVYNVSDPNFNDLSDLELEHVELNSEGEVE